MSPDTGLAVNTQQNALSKNEDQKERKKKTMHKIGASLYPPPPDCDRSVLHVTSVIILHYYFTRRFATFHQYYFYLFC